MEIICNHSNNICNIFDFLPDLENQQQKNTEEKIIIPATNNNNYVEFEKGKDFINMKNYLISSIHLNNNKDEISGGGGGGGDFLKHPPNFNGYCYYCDCPKHSQNYCPLRLCPVCNEYGHSIKVCPKNTASGSENWREKLNIPISSGNFKYWKPYKQNYVFSSSSSYQYKNYNRKPPLPAIQKKYYSFGSTWKNMGELKHIDENWRKIYNPSDNNLHNNLPNNQQLSQEELKLNNLKKAHHHILPIEIILDDDNE
jgi:hypothetical protein